MTYRLICADVIDGLMQLPDESVNCVVTSPPYYGLRDYGVAGQIGLEETQEAYVARLVDVFREVRRVLKKDGTCWLNLGDSYAGRANAGGEASRTCESAPNAKDRNIPTKRGNGLKPKDLIGIPWRVAFALQAAGWWLRSDIVWAKPNPMPESVTDRPTKSHEYLFLLSKSARYLYNSKAIAEPCGGFNGSSFTSGKTHDARCHLAAVGKRERAEPNERNKRSVWSVATQPYSEAHFAPLPEKLVEPCILAGCSEGGTVLDPFAGSGTVGVAALRHGRKFIGIDLNPAYIAMARKRIHDSAPLLNQEVA